MAKIVSYNHPNNYKKKQFLQTDKTSKITFTLNLVINIVMRGSRKFRRRGSNFDFFLVDEGREDPSTSISGPSSAYKQNAIKWRFAGMPMMAQH